MTHDEAAHSGRRLLFILPDLDAPPTKGYQVRCVEMAAALSDRHDVRVLSSRSSPDRETVAADRRPLWRVGSAVGRLFDGSPLQAAPFDGPDVARRVRRVVAEWRPDAIIVMTERMPETVEALCSEVLIVDIVDAMRMHMEQRARNSRFPVRILWAREARAFKRQAGRLQRCAAAIVAASRSALVDFPVAHVIPNAARADALARGVQTIDVIFTGNLAYWPNVRAAIEVCEVIAPRIRAVLPGATIVVAGRRPSPAVRRACAAAGVALRADVPDLRALVRASRLALAPLPWTPGGNLKILEAVAAGTPVLCYPAAREQLPTDLEGVRECGDADEMADAAIGFLRGHETVVAGPRDLHTWPARARSLEDLVDGLLTRRPQTH